MGIVGAQATAHAKRLQRVVHRQRPHAMGLAIDIEHGEMAGQFLRRLWCTVSSEIVGAGANDVAVGGDVFRHQ
ncbi:hypothetical protein D3C80_2159760 [compost metagenome]